jgi:cytochrome c2
MGADKKEEYPLFGDVKEGWKVFNKKNCIQCHSIWGQGGKEGPDLGTSSESYVTPSRLAALMWNHWPAMREKISTKKIPLEKIEKKEMSDLFAFLYFIGYMADPGDPKEGKRVMEIKFCGNCHNVREESKGDLNRWGTFFDPVLWAQMMWSHAPQMEQEMKKKGLPSVKFKGYEMSDLVAYIRSLSPKIEKVYLLPGDSSSGAGLFIQKGCMQCHVPKGEMDLSKDKYSFRTLTQLAGAMWNHSQQISKEMEEKRIVRPSLSPQEMADITAYLFSIRYFDEPGDPDFGKTLFIKKQCVVCHNKEDRKFDLSRLKGQISPIFMVQTLWNHGSEMLERMKSKKVSWEKFYYNDMADLIEYLNRGMP